MYIDEENALVEDINNLFVDLSNYYKTDNLNAIENWSQKLYQFCKFTFTCLQYYAFITKRRNRLTGGGPSCIICV